MASKGTTTATKFEVEKFDGKVNFLLWKMRITSLLVKEGTYRALQVISKKPSDMDEDDWQHGCQNRDPDRGIVRSYGFFPCHRAGSVIGSLASIGSQRIVGSAVGS